MTAATRIACVLVLAVVSTPALAITIGGLDPPPVERQLVTLSFDDDAGRPAAGVEVTAIYRENAHATLRTKQIVGTTDASGTVRWTPERAGVVVLSWDGGTRNVSVLYDGSQPGAILIAVLAGLALLGGSAVFFIKMLGEGRVGFEEEPDTPPST